MNEPSDIDDGGATEEAPSARAAFVPTLAGVAAEDVARTLGTVWRQAAGHDAPTLLQLAQRRVSRIDVDEAAGYVAVRVGGETYRAIGVRRDLVAALVSMLAARPLDEVQRLLAKGPVRIEAEG